jgi:hypothetical protein
MGHALRRENESDYCWSLPPLLGNVRVRVRVTLRLAVYRQSVRLGDKPLENHDQHFFFQLNTCGYSPYVTPSLTRGRFCRLQLLLGLASAVILRSESRRTFAHILLSQIRDSPNWRVRSRLYIPQKKGGPVISPGTWIPFRRLLRLSELRWRYSTPPPHGIWSSSVLCYDRRSVGQFVLE